MLCLGEHEEERGLAWTLLRREFDLLGDKLHMAGHRAASEWSLDPDATFIRAQLEACCGQAQAEIEVAKRQISTYLVALEVHSAATKSAGRRRR